MQPKIMYFLKYWNLSYFADGGIYYVPPGMPGYVRTPPYYPPIVPPAGVMHGPDPITLRSMIMKQIEYYFRYFEAAIRRFETLMYFEYQYLFFSFIVLRICVKMFTYAQIWTSKDLFQ